jgi:hypothetical protein
METQTAGPAAMYAVVERGAYRHDVPAVDLFESEDQARQYARDNFDDPTDVDVVPVTDRRLAP